MICVRPPEDRRCGIVVGRFKGRVETRLRYEKIWGSGWKYGASLTVRRKTVRWKQWAAFAAARYEPLPRPPLGRRPVAADYIFDRMGKIFIRASRWIGASILLCI